MTELENVIGKLNKVLAENSAEIKKTEDMIAVSVAYDKGGRAAEEDAKKKLQELVMRKDSLYEERSQMKKDLKDLQTARYNLEMMLAKDREK